MEVDQAAALVVMSSDEADRRGIPDRRRVGLPRRGVGDRRLDADRAGQPDIQPRLPGGRRRPRSSTPPCTQPRSSCSTSTAVFPSAVELAMKALSLAVDDPRPRTVTGGLAYAGGPGNSYSTHALAAMVAPVAGHPGPGRVRVGPRHVGDQARRVGAVQRSGPDRGRQRDRVSADVPVPDKVRLGPAAGRPSRPPARQPSRPTRSSTAATACRCAACWSCGCPTAAAPSPTGIWPRCRTLVTEEAVGRRGRVTPGPDGGAQPVHPRTGPP